jgi:DNA-binding CsgD family transcriptional regulator
MNASHDQVETSAVQITLAERGALQISADGHADREIAAILREHLVVAALAKLPVQG